MQPNQPALLTLLLKYSSLFITALILILLFQKMTKPDLISFAVTHEELVPVDRISVVVQFTTLQNGKDNLVSTADTQFRTFLSQISAIPSTSYQESAAQVTQVGVSGFQYLKTARIDLADPSQYAALKNILDNSPIQIAQTIYTPSQNVDGEKKAYQGLLEKSRLQAKNIAAATGKWPGGVVTVIEAAPQLREGSSAFTTYSNDGTLMMNITKSATFQYSLY